MDVMDGKFSDVCEPERTIEKEGERERKCVCEKERESESE